MAIDPSLLMQSSTAARFPSRTVGDLSQDAAVFQRNRDLKWGIEKYGLDRDEARRMRGEEAFKTYSALIGQGKWQEAAAWEPFLEAHGFKVTPTEDGSTIEWEKPSYGGTPGASLGKRFVAGPKAKADPTPVAKPIAQADPGELAAETAVPPQFAEGRAERERYARTPRTEGAALPQREYSPENFQRQLAERQAARAKEEMSDEEFGRLAEQAEKEQQAAPQTHGMTPEEYLRIKDAITGRVNPFGLADDDPLRRAKPVPMPDVVEEYNQRHPGNPLPPRSSLEREGRLRGGRVDPMQDAVEDFNQRNPGNPLPPRSSADGTALGGGYSDLVDWADAPPIGGSVKLPDLVSDPPTGGSRQLGLGRPDARTRKIFESLRPDEPTPRPGVAQPVAPDAGVTAPAVPPSVSGKPPSAPGVVIPADPGDVASETAARHGASLKPWFGSSTPGHMPIRYIDERNKAEVAGFAAGMRRQYPNRHGVTDAVIGSGQTVDEAQKWSEPHYLNLTPEERAKIAEAGKPETHGPVIKMPSAVQPEDVKWQIQQVQDQFKTSGVNEALAAAKSALDLMNEGKEGAHGIVITKIVRAGGDRTVSDRDKAMAAGTPHAWDQTWQWLKRMYDSQSAENPIKLTPAEVQRLREAVMVMERTAMVQRESHYNSLVNIYRSAKTEDGASTALTYIHSNYPDLAGRRVEEGGLPPSARSPVLLAPGTTEKDARGAYELPPGVKATPPGKTNGGGGGAGGALSRIRAAAKARKPQ